MFRFLHLRPQRRAGPWACGVLALMLTPLASAQSLPPPGRLLASNCFQCHGTNGNGPGFDRLAGKPFSDLYGDLRDFQKKEQGIDIMAKHSLGYTDAQLQLIAKWLSTQPAVRSGS